MKPNWPTKKLGEVIDINYGKGLHKNNRIDSGKYLAYGSNGPVYSTDESLTNGEIIVIGRKGTAGALYFVSKPCWPIDTTFFAKPKNNTSLKFVYYLLQTKNLPRLAIVTGVPGINRTTLVNINVQLPPLKIQKQIVERMDKIAEAQKLNEELIQKSDELFQSLLHKELNPTGKNWQKRVLADVCEFIGGGTPSKENPSFWNGDIPWVFPKDMRGWEIFDTEDHVTQQGVENSSTHLIPVNSVLIVFRSGILKHSVPLALSKRLMALNQDMKALLPRKDISSFFLFFWLLGSIQKIKTMVKMGGTVHSLQTNLFQNLSIYIPNSDTQKQIVEKLSAVQNYKKLLIKQDTLLKELFDSVLDKSVSGQLDS